MVEYGDNKLCEKNDTFWALSKVTIEHGMYKIEKKSSKDALDAEIKCLSWRNAMAMHEKQVLKGNKENLKIAR